MTGRRLLALASAFVMITGCASSSEFWDREPRVAGLRRPAARPAPRRAPARQAPPPDRRARPQPETWVEAPSSGVGASPTTGPTQEDRQVLDRVNQIRRARGLHEFVWCPTIFRAAYDHSTEQHVHGYMGHSSPDPRRERLAQRMRLAGYQGRMFGEVVAWNYRTVEGVVRGWMNSPSHRSILLDREMTEAAFSRVGLYWTGNFGAPRAVVRSQPAPPRRRPTSASGPQFKSEAPARLEALDELPAELPALPSFPSRVEPVVPALAPAPRTRTVRRLDDPAPPSVRRVTVRPPEPLPAPRSLPPAPPTAERPMPRTVAPPSAPEPAPRERVPVRPREQGSCYVPPVGAVPPPVSPSGRGSG